MGIFGTTSLKNAKKGASFQIDPRAFRADQLTNNQIKEMLTDLNLHPQTKKIVEKEAKDRYLI